MKVILRDITAVLFLILAIVAAIMVVAYLARPIKKEWARDRALVVQTAHNHQLEILMVQQEHEIQVLLNQAIWKDGRLRVLMQSLSLMVEQYVGTLTDEPPLHRLRKR